MQIRLLGESDLEAISQIHIPTHPHRTAELLRWEFFSPSLPCEGLILGMYDGDALIATQAYIPVLSYVDGQEVLTAKSELTLINPDYRGQGIFERLCSTAIPHLEARNIQFIWGFTSATKPFGRAGFEVFGTLYNEVFVFSPWQYLQLRKKLRTCDPAVTQISGSARQPLAMHCEVANNGLALSLAESRLAYRYVENPERQIAVIDDTAGILISASRSTPCVWLLSELCSFVALPEAVRQARRSGAVALERFSTHPAKSGDKGLYKGSLYYRKLSDMKIVWQRILWQGAIPEFRVEEGYKEGVVGL